MKSSKLVNTVLVSTPLFIAGCGGCGYTVYEERAYHDGVPIATVYQPGYHWSPYYHGYVPVIVPIGGFSGGNTYHTVYNQLPPEKQRQYATPVTGRTKTTNSTQPNSTRRPTNPTGTITPSTKSSASAPHSTSGTQRGVAGTIGSGTVSS